MWQTCKYAKFATWIVLITILSACDHPAIFSTNPEARSTQDSTASFELVEVHISGGIAGIHDVLLVKKDGVIQYTRSSPFGPIFTDILAQEELAALQSTLANSNFTRLNDKYITTNAADLFFYQIRLNQDGFVKTVTTDYPAAPRALKPVIDYFNALTQRLLSRDLELKLETSSDTVAAGQPLGLKLLVSNRASQPIRLHFRSGQTHEFTAFSPGTDAGPTQSLPEIWRWSSDRAFIQVVQNYDLQPGETLTYEVTWDGVSDSGEKVTGSVWIRGELVSIPGGSPPMQRVYVK